MMAAAAVGLPASAAAEMVDAVVAKQKPSVIWLHFQECTGCTESLLRTSHPALDELLLDLISLDYHETLFVAAGHQVEAARRAGDGGERAASTCSSSRAPSPPPTAASTARSAGRRRMEMVREVASRRRGDHRHRQLRQRGAASPPRAPTRPGRPGCKEMLPGKTVVSIPGCPANPYNLLGAVLQYATYGTLPELDEQGPPEVRLRPHHPRGLPAPAALRRRPLRASSSATRATATGSASTSWAARGPMTYANCSLQHFCEVPGAWPDRHRAPLLRLLAGRASASPSPCTTPPPSPGPRRPTPIAPIHAAQGRVSPTATALAGGLVGGAGGAGFMVSKQARRGGARRGPDVRRRGVEA